MKRKNWFLMATAAIAFTGAWMPSVRAIDAFAGQAVYETHCMDCHGIDGVPLTPDTPDFSIGQGLDKPDGLLFEAVSNGRNLMPQYDGVIDDEEILNVIAYIRTLQR